MDWEFAILDAIQNWHNPILDKFMTAVSFLGNAGWFWIALAILLLLGKRYRTGGLYMTAALIPDFLITNLWLKNMVARPRPCWERAVDLLVANPTDYSFPSGHSAAGFAAATALFCWNKKAGICAYILTTLIAFSRLYLYVHFPTDVLAGALIGVICGLIGSFVVKKTGSHYETGSSI